MTYKATKIQSFNGTDGVGFTAILCRGIQPVAEAHDGARGGPVRFRWFDTDNRTTVHTLNYKDEPHQYQGTVEEAAFAKFCMEQPLWSFKSGADTITTHQGPDMVMTNLVEYAETEASLKRTMRNKLVFTTGGKQYSLGKKGVDPMQYVDSVKSKYADVQIMNTMPLEEAVRITLQLAKG